MGLEGSLLLTFSPLSTERERKREKEINGVNIEAEDGANQNLVMLDQKHTGAVGYTP